MIIDRLVDRQDRRYFLPMMLDQTRATHTAPLDGATVVISLASFSFGAFMISEFVAHWGFGRDAGWLGIVFAVVASVGLTVLFRDRMRVIVPSPGIDG